MRGVCRPLSRQASTRACVGVEKDRLAFLEQWILSATEAVVNAAWQRFVVNMERAVYTHGGDHVVRFELTYRFAQDAVDPNPDQALLRVLVDGRHFMAHTVFWGDRNTTAQFMEQVRRALMQPVPAPAV